MGGAQLEAFFSSKRFPTDLIRGRGPSLPIESIAKDDRYLIAEMACKSYGGGTDDDDLRTVLIEAFNEHRAKNGAGAVAIRSLLDGEFSKKKHNDRQPEFAFSAEEVLGATVDSVDEINAKYDQIARRFDAARAIALRNTKLYLSMVGDLDVYVATSMRSRSDFRAMATACDDMFSDSRLRDLQVRYFDPTLSAAAGHEDKGLIECLMVRCAKVLVYCAGEKESYGKDAEAAMALSLGKPVIFYCEKPDKLKFYRDVHPLTRLIEFSSGVAVGAMVTDSLKTVSELLCRLFENNMQYQLEHPKNGYIKLKEQLTGCTVRLQTSDIMLQETFWNYYHTNPTAA
jgi:hypothetical protein